MGKIPLEVPFFDGMFFTSGGIHVDQRTIKMQKLPQWIRLTL